MDLEYKIEKARNESDNLDIGGDIALSTMHVLFANEHVQSVRVNAKAD